MIKYNPKSWFKLLLQAQSRSIVKILFPMLIFIAVFTAIVAYIEVDYLHLEIENPTVLHSLLGIVLGLFLVFRTNTAYDRWWEGRKLWGGLVNCSRNFALKIDAMLPDKDEDLRSFFQIQIADYANALRLHLREKETPEVHLPNNIAKKMYRKLNSLYSEKKISGDQFIILDADMKLFTDIMGACERIKNTPIPFSYSMYMKKVVFIYIITLPFGFVTIYGYWTILIALILTYVLFSIELIAEEIEDPFGEDDNDLPTDTITINIAKNSKDILLKSSIVN